VPEPVVPSVSDETLPSTVIVGRRYDFPRLESRGGWCTPVFILTP
jgi:hypothetical protein